jgi:endonuclease III
VAGERALARAVVERYGQTFAEQAGIRLEDRPAPLYQLAVLATLLSARINANVAVAAARELFGAGLRTPARMAGSTARQRVDALGRGHYRRYDERTSAMLDTGARLVLDRWGGDLRRMHGSAGADPDRLRATLKELPGIGDVGADIFLREAQAVWPDLRPYADERTRRTARELGLPDRPDALARLVGPDDLPRLVAGLVRLSLDRRAARELAEQTR